MGINAVKGPFPPDVAKNFATSEKFERPQRMAVMTGRTAAS